MKTSFFKLGLIALTLSLGACASNEYGDAKLSHNGSLVKVMKIKTTRHCKPLGAVGLHGGKSLAAADRFNSIDRRFLGDGMAKSWMASPRAINLMRNQTAQLGGNHVNVEGPTYGTAFECTGPKSSLRYPEVEGHYARFKH